MSSKVPAIAARSLTKYYGRHRGIVDVDLEVSPGEIVGLVGANGAGKTTLMRTLLDFIRPTGGAVSIFGHDSVREPVAVRRLSTYLPGELVVPPRLTGHQAVRRFAFARRSLDPGAVEALAERFDLDLTRRVGDLSKGNKQKLGVVLAFAPEPRLLVLDEPTSGLDPLLQREFAALVAETAAAGGTVMLSSHVMSEVEEIATRVALMREGTVAVVDDVSAITARARRRARVRPHEDADLAALAAALTRVPNVSEVTVEDGAVTLACSGDMDAMLKTVSRFGVHALDVAHADLEDAFFAAYDAPDGDGAWP